MLHWLPAPLLGVVSSLMLVLNTLLWIVPVYGQILLKLLTPKKSRARHLISAGIAWACQHWALFNVWITDSLMRIDWDVRMEAEIDPKGQYLVCANHQTWNDILGLIRAFGTRAPFFKFFLKRELIYVPVLGLAWWGLDYPFMARHTKEQIARNPALKGKDIEATRRACEAFRDQPALILNFLEGTRFTPAKQARQKSPYQHLLRPKSGGFAFALSALGERLHSLIDVTIVYPDGPVGFWDFLCGRMRRVIIEVRKLEVPSELFHGSYENDPEFRARFHSWIGALWQRKDRRIAELLAETRTTAA
ncbi:acyltransferase [Solimonas marina]|uniref:Acyltransferase n=1 Tax=Solimonas marina TaxID=2714601 RepID=A0A970B7V1_9GAMM|nr:acyltransferase [Solimonas marina]NKF21609.1 acyltransferase [Solimonas marina]